MIAALQRLFSRLDPAWRHSAKWFLLAMLVGVVAGAGAILFQFLSQGLFDLAMGKLAGYHPRLPGGERGHGAATLGTLLPWAILVLPTLGGLLAGWLVFRFAPEAEGHGTDAALEAYHKRGGMIPWRVPLVKTVASALTLGTGGSGGREGPIAQIGAGFGALIAARMRLSARDRRILLAAGIGAGVGAIFRAPLAGALFASEIHYWEPEFETEAVIPSAVASIMSYCVFSFAYGWEPLFTTATFSFNDPRELLPYTVLAVAVSVGGYAFVRVFYGMRDLFARLPMPRSLKPALGGLLTGTVGLLLYVAFGHEEVLSVLSFGYGTVQGALDGQVGIGLLLAVALGKMLTTGLTIGSGGSGGVFGPSMVIGGAIGGAVGLTLQGWFPTLVAHPGSYVLVGMAGFFAGAANTPISTIIMVSEMTGNYNLLLPALWVTTISFILQQRVCLYEQQVRCRADSPAHRGDFHHDVLEDMKVGDVYDSTQKPIVFAQGVPLGEVFRRISATQQNYFPTVDDDGRMCGIFSLNDIREYLYEEAVWEIAIAADFAQSDVTWVHPHHDLSTAISRFTERNVDELPVVRADDPGMLVGMLRRKDVVDAYNRRVWAMRQEEGAAD